MWEPPLFGFWHIASAIAARRHIPGRARPWTHKKGFSNRRIADSFHPTLNGRFGMARFDLTDFEWSVIEPLLPNKPRGVARVDDRRVLNGIFWRLRTGAPWADIPPRYGPHTTCVNRFNRWRKAGVWDRLLSAVSRAYSGDIQMIDSSSIRVHSTLPTPKKRRSIQLHGSLAWWADNQNPRACRCLRVTDPS